MKKRVKTGIEEYKNPDMAMDRYNFFMVAGLVPSLIVRKGDKMETQTVIDTTNLICYAPFMVGASKNKFILIKL